MSLSATDPSLTGTSKGDSRAQPSDFPTVAPGGTVTLAWTTSLGGSRRLLRIEADGARSEVASGLEASGERPVEGITRDCTFRLEVTVEPGRPLLWAEVQVHVGDEHSVSTIAQVNARSAELAGFPLLLCGPMLRRVAPSGEPGQHSVSVFFAAKDPVSATLRVRLRGQEKWAESPPAPTVPLGPALHAAVVTGLFPLEAGALYEYDLLLPGDGGAARSLVSPGVVQAGALGDALGPGEGALPSFLAPPARLDALRIAHGSCRKPGGQSVDALSLVDRLLADQDQRPHQLILTGDQIYADEVEPCVLDLLRERARVILDADGEGFSETLPAAGAKVPARAWYELGLDLDRGVEILARLPGWADKKESTCHLLFLHEFFALYLLSFSPALWGPHGLPADRFDRGRLLEAEPELARARVRQFVRTLPAVRRVLANVPTFTICDDHEVTDDWNIDAFWIRDLARTPLQARLVRNALSAYAVFQDWGNRPERYAPGGAGAGLLDALRLGGGPEQWTPPPWLDPGGAPAKALDQLLLPLGASGDEGAAAAPPAPDGGAEGPPHAGRSAAGGELSWDYRITFPTHRLLVLDTRTRRHFPEGDPDQPWLPQLVSGASLDQQLPAPADGLLDVVVSATPIFGVPAVEKELEWVREVKGSRETDQEDWACSPIGQANAIRRLARGARTVVLSGDVHYAFSLAVDLGASRGGAAPLKRARIAQLCSSSLRHEDHTSRLGWVGNLGPIARAPGSPGRQPAGTAVPAPIDAEAKARGRAGAIGYTTTPLEDQGTSGYDEGGAAAQAGPGVRAAFPRVVPCSNFGLVSFAAVGGQTEVTHRLHWVVPKWKFLVPKDSGTVLPIPPLAGRAADAVPGLPPTEEYLPETGADFVVCEHATRLDGPSDPATLGVLGEELETRLGLTLAEALARSASAVQFRDQIHDLFGAEILETAIDRLRQGLLDRTFPDCPVLIGGETEGHAAAYSKERMVIAVDRAAVDAAKTSVDGAATLACELVHEFGHYLDGQLRRVLSTTGGDAKGEEGALFAFAIVHSGLDLGEELLVAVHEGEEIKVSVAALSESAREHLAEEAAQGKDYEFFGAGDGDKDAPPGCSYGHRSIQDPALEACGYTKEEQALAYFGNWLRDFSQMLVHWCPPGVRSEAVRRVACAAALAEFGSGPEFQVTDDRLGVYRPEEHIDNPYGLGPPMDAAFRPAYDTAEGAVDPEFGTKRYIRTAARSPLRLPAPIGSALFETDKAFPLPGAMPQLQAFAAQARREPASDLVIVGHTDTVGSHQSNLTLSRERGLSLQACLARDVDAWINTFYAHPDPLRRWGAREDKLMVDAVGDPAIALPPANPVDTPARRKLVAAYMALAGSPLSESMARGCKVVGASFDHPAPGARREGSEEEAAGPGVPSADNRRVDLLLFRTPPDPLPAECRRRHEANQPCDAYQAWKRQLAAAAAETAAIAGSAAKYACDPASILAYTLRSDDTADQLLLGNASTAGEFIASALTIAATKGRTAEGLRGLGAALHALQDYYSHSNFIELALIEVGRKDVFAWARKRMALPGTPLDGKLPVVTGCFALSDTFVSLISMAGETLSKAGRKLPPAISMDLMVAGFGFSKLADETAALQDSFLGDAEATDPTHSQLAKDHDEHPLHAIAAQLAISATKDVAGVMLQVWSGALPAAAAVDCALKYLVHPATLKANRVSGAPMDAGLQALWHQITEFEKDPANLDRITQVSDPNWMGTVTRNARKALAAAKKRWRTGGVQGAGEVAQ